MAGLVPAIHVLETYRNVDIRHEAGLTIEKSAEN
jgi:hypothetical protein